MKIVKRNDKLNPPKWHAQCTCAHCESVLDVEETDLRHLQYDNGGRDYIDDAVFKCPACDRWNSIPVSGISQYVKTRLKSVKFDDMRGSWRSCRVDVAYHIQDSSD